MHILSDDMSPRVRLAVALTVVLVAAGCLGSLSPSDPTTATTEDPPESPTLTHTVEPTTASTSTLLEPTSTPSGTTRPTEQACNGVSVAFYKLGEDVIWDPDRIPIGVSLGAGGNVTVAVFENDTLLGTAQVTAPNDTGVGTDGLPIHLETKLSDTHTIRVVAYPNTNGDGQFNSETATPCRRDGAVVRTESRMINFSTFTDDSTPTAETSTSIDTTHPSTTPTESTTASTSTRTTSTTETSNLVSSGSGDYPHEIRFENALNESRTITVTVRRDGNIIYQESHDAPANSTTVLAGFTRENLTRGDTSVNVAYATNGQEEVAGNFPICWYGAYTIGDLNETGALHATKVTAMIGPDVETCRERSNQ